MSTSACTEPFSEAELDAFLNRMLEAERAGARALVVYMESFARGSPGWKLLRQVQSDEAHNCALIGEQLKRRGRDYSHATGGYDLVSGETVRVRLRPAVGGGVLLGVYQYAIESASGMIGPYRRLSR